MHPSTLLSFLPLLAVANAAACKKREEQPPAVNSTLPLSEIPDNESRYTDPAEGGGRRIRVAGREDLCVMVMNAFTTVGAEVALARCLADGDTFTEYQMWDFSDDGTHQIRMHSHPELCIDGGDRPPNGSPINLAQCSENTHVSHAWDWGNNGILQLGTGDWQCLTVAKDSKPSTSKPYVSVRDLQTWGCNRTDPYQQFALWNGPDAEPWVPPIETHQTRPE